MFDATGQRLFDAVVADFELGEHEVALLTQAAHVADVCAALQALVDDDGPMVSVRGEVRAHPALIELRQQRALLSRLLVSLRVPMDAEGDEKRAQRRGGARGFYGIKGGAA